MATLKQLIDELSFTHHLGTLVEVTQDTAVSRMQEIRATVLATRQYMESLIVLFEELRAAKTEEVAHILEQKIAYTLSAAQPSSNQERFVTVLFTSSGRFAGGISNKVIEQFLAQLPQMNSDVVVVGEKGKEVVPNITTKRPVQYFDINIDNPDLEQVDALLAYLRQYASISVFTGKFENLVSQVPAAYNITGHEVLRTTQQPQNREETEYLFEPEVKEIVDFFDAQVTASLFDKTVAESKLASLGSRIMALEAARTNISDQAQALSRRARRLKKKQSRRKQFNRLSGSTLWR